MMKILTGVLPKTAGQIIYNGVPEENYNAKIAKQIGVSCAYQDLSLCTNLSISKICDAECQPQYCTKQKLEK